MKKYPLLIPLVILVVIVGGFWYRASRHPQAAPVSTSGWKTYANTKYGYSFKYPAGLTSSSDYSPSGSTADTVFVFDQTKGASDGFGVDVRTQPIAPLKQVYTNAADFVKDYSAGQKVDTTQATFAGVDAMRVTAPEQYTSPTGYIFIKDGKVYFVTWPSSQPEIWRIADTFAFTK